MSTLIGEISPTGMIHIHQRLWIRRRFLYRALGDRYVYDVVATSDIGHPNRRCAPIATWSGPLHNVRRLPLLQHGASCVMLRVGELLEGLYQRRAHWYRLGRRPVVGLTRVRP